MTIIMIVVIGSGILTGYFVLPLLELYISNIQEIVSYLLDIGLCVLLLLVGIDMGKQKKVLKQIKKIGMDILVVPVMIAIGSIVGSMVAGRLLGMPLNEAGAVGAGFGWYTLSSVLLIDYSTELSAIAFLSNVIREIMAIILIPFISKYIGELEAIAPSAATAMDTTLPIISKYTSSKTAIVAFVTGVILSILVPILVPLILNM